jgi:hypothetical protein
MARVRRKHPVKPVKTSSLQHRVRSRFMGFGLWTSALVFFVTEGYVLQDQWEIGHASAMFMLGTAFLVAGFCIGLFAIIVAIGLAISAACGAEPRRHVLDEPGPVARIERLGEREEDCHGHGAPARSSRRSSPFRQPIETPTATTMATSWLAQLRQLTGWRFDAHARSQPDN